MARSLATTSAVESHVTIELRGTDPTRRALKKLNGTLVTLHGRLFASKCTPLETKSCVTLPLRTLHPRSPCPLRCNYTQLSLSDPLATLSDPKNRLSSATVDHLKFQDCSFHQPAFLSAHPALTREWWDHPSSWEGVEPVRIQIGIRNLDQHAGIQLHSGNTRTWNFAGERPLNMAYLGSNVWNPLRIKILGTPVGHEEFVANFLEERLTENRK